MYSRRYFGAGVAVLAAALVGCLSVTDVHTHQGCTAWYDTAWNSYVRFSLNHSDSRTCPLGIQYGAPASSGGVVYDRTAVYGSGTFPNTWFLETRAFDLNVGTAHDCTFPLGNLAYQSFAWGQPEPGTNQSYGWRAEGWVSYNAGDSPDFTCFRVAFSTNPAPFVFDAHAVVTINYWGDQNRRRSDTVGE
jgi:hypothetical protein